MVVVGPLHLLDQWADKITGGNSEIRVWMYDNVRDGDLDELGDFHLDDCNE